MSTEPTIVFLDANVIAKPVTRTLLMAGGAFSGFRAVWSLAAEQEAIRHMRTRAVSPTVIRERFHRELGPTGEASGRFAATKSSDRQILADATAAAARFLITEDVDDFGLNDLMDVGISAVNPDLFLAERLTREAYEAVIELFVKRQVNPPTTPAKLHAALARQHPRLFAAHADLFDIRPQRSGHPEPSVIFRGTRCLRSERIADDPSDLIDGVLRS